MQAACLSAQIPISALDGGKQARTQRSATAMAIELV
jgi:hypothetical protein